MNISIENMQECILVSSEMEKLIYDTVNNCFRYEGFDIDSEISIFLVDDPAIQSYNKEYRGKDCATDVLSFPMIEGKDGQLQIGAGDYNGENGLLLLGDLVISLETAERQAKEYGHSFQRELAFLTTHGIFHLLGYDHENESWEKVMIDKQEAVLEIIGLKRDQT